jgi:hypothetical protein
MATKFELKTKVTNLQHPLHHEEANGQILAINVGLTIVTIDRTETLKIVSAPTMTRTRNVSSSLDQKRIDDKV